MGDLNRDGRLTGVAKLSGTVSTVLGNGDGTFTAPVDLSMTGNPLFVSIGDLNRDGKPDLAVVNTGSDRVSVLLGNGDGTFLTPVPYAVGAFPASVAIADLNRDGKPDLVAANSGTGSPNDDVSVLLGNGDGTFATAVSYAVGDRPRSIAIADLNGDGRADMAVTNTFSDNVSILIGNGDGTFGAAAQLSVPGAPESVATGDFNHDGALDLAVAFFFQGVSVLLGHGDGTFATAVPYVFGDGPVMVAVGDMNRDGHPDLVIANTNAANYASILLGNGDGSFAAPVNHTGAVRANSLAIGDVNGDGSPDIAIADETFDQFSVLLNRCGATNLEAVAISTSQVSVGWDAVQGASSYDVFRSANNSAYTLVGSTAINNFLDSGVAANTTYLYRVNAVYAAADQGPASAIDLATTIVFTDAIVAGVTPVKAVHLTELRTAVNAVRAAKGLPPGSFTNPIAPGALIRALDVIELRSNLDAARAGLGLPPVMYIDPALGPSTPIKRAHILQLRLGVQ